MKGKKGGESIILIQGIVVSIPYTAVTIKTKVVNIEKKTYFSFSKKTRCFSPRKWCEILTISIYTYKQSELGKCKYSNTRV